MTTTELINEIGKLPMQKRIFVIEKSIQSMRKEEDSNQMKKAADALVLDYTTDKELTIFTNLDFEEFYEAR